MPVYEVEPVTGTSKLKMKVLYRNMPIPTGYGHPVGRKVPMDISSSTEDSKDEYVLAEVKDVAILDQLPEAKPGGLQQCGG